MKRTIEKLARDRRDKEEYFAKKILEFKDRAQSLDQKTLVDSLSELLELQNALTDARDREWDALGSNHVGTIFKSMEWRVDRLAAAYEDSQALTKTFVLLKEQLDQLLAVLEDKKLPAAAQVREVLEPLEDVGYRGFEARFRGSETEIRRQLAPHVSYFRPGGKVLDLGCGSGEFLELLQKSGLEGLGVDKNGQMIDRCRDKGLNCTQGDILEELSEQADESLDGVFSSQVIEHLPPAYLKRLVELGHSKLAPGGVIVLETVNPASVFALVQIYFLDPTHQKPVHPSALGFLLESAGFEDVEIKYSSDLGGERLQYLPGADEISTIYNRNIDRLNGLLFSPANYAAIGKKR